MTAFDTVTANLAEQFGLTPYEGGFVTAAGLFITQRPNAGWLWDVWPSFEVSRHGGPLVAGNRKSLAEAVQVANAEGF
jgi:hypothetical protein